MSRVVIDCRDHQLDVYNDWITDPNLVSEAHQKCATHILFDDGELCRVEVGFFRRGEPYVMLCETVGNYEVRYM